MRSLRKGDPHPLVLELREERLGMGLAQDKVPGMGRKMVGSWERGHAIPTVASLEQYAAGLGFDLILEEFD